MSYARHGICIPLNIDHNIPNTLTQNRRFTIYNKSAVQEETFFFNIESMTYDPRYTALTYNPRYTWLTNKYLYMKDQDKRLRCSIRVTQFGHHRSYVTTTEEFICLMGLFYRAVIRRRAKKRFRAARKRILDEVYPLINDLHDIISLYL